MYSLIRCPLTELLLSLFELSSLDLFALGFTAKVYDLVAG